MKINLSTQKQRFRWALALLCIVTVTLVVLLMNLPDSGVTDATESYTPPEIEPVDTYPTETLKPDIQEPEKEDGPAPTKPIDPVETQPDKNIYLVIDDVGNNLINLELFLDLDIPITYAVLPRRTFSRESFSRIRAHSQTAILHQPMEPEGNGDPGKGTIYTGMSGDEIIRVLDANLSGLAGVVGMNNHMGSKVTSDEQSMHKVMAYLANTGLFFLDSVTTNKSVAEAAALAYNVPFARRTGVFLDNQPEYEAILENWEKGLAVAKKTGDVVMIGHVQSKALVDVIRDTVKELTAKGYTFKSLIEYPAFSKS